MRFYKNDAISILKPFFSDFRQCVESGFSTCLTEYKPYTHLYARRTKASLVHDHIIDEARKTFADKNNTTIIETNGLFLIDVGGEILIRFKKFNTDLKSSNFPTKQQLCFKQQLHLPGIPPDLPRLEAGYVPNPLWTKLEGIYITYPIGDKINWFIEIEENSKKPKTIPLPFPLNPPQDNLDTKRVRVKKIEPIDIKSKRITLKEKK